MSGGQPQPVEPPPPVPGATEAVSAWILLRSFASGCTAMTGVEAVSNGVPLFKKPEVPRAQWTLTIIAAVLAAFLLAISYLSPAYKIHAMNEEQPGYQTIYSQLVAAVAGRGVFYYIAIASIFTILTFSAQTSFADFPRVCGCWPKIDSCRRSSPNAGGGWCFQATSSLWRSWPDCC